MSRRLRSMPFGAEPRGPVGINVLSSCLDVAINVRRDLATCNGAGEPQKLAPAPLESVVLEQPAYSSPISGLAAQGGSRGHRDLRVRLRKRQCTQRRSWRASYATTRSPGSFSRRDCMAGYRAGIWQDCSRSNEGGRRDAQQRLDLSRHHQLLRQFRNNRLAANAQEE